MSAELPRALHKILPLQCGVSTEVSVDVPRKNTKSPVGEFAPQKIIVPSNLRIFSVISSIIACCWWRGSQLCVELLFVLVVVDVVGLLQGSFHVVVCFGTRFGVAHFCRCVLFVSCEFLCWVLF